jgi:hypothetical protein
VTSRVEIAVEVPFVFEAESVYMKVPVAFGVTDTVPVAVEVERLRSLPEMRTDDTFDVFHESWVEEPKVMLEEEKEKEEMVGAEPVDIAGLSTPPTMPPSRLVTGVARSSAYESDGI